MTRAIAQLRDPEDGGMLGQFELEQLTGLWMFNTPAEWIAALDKVIEEMTDEE